MRFTMPSRFSISLTQMIKLTFGPPDKVQSINWKILQNFLHVLLHLNGLNSTVITYQGEAADEMRALLSDSLASDLSESDDNIAANAYTFSYGQPKRYNEADTCTNDDYKPHDMMKETNLKKIELHITNHTENTIPTKSPEMEKMSNLTCKIFEPYSGMASQTINEISKRHRQAGGGNIAEEVAHMHKRMSQIENQINVLNENLNNFTSQNNESKGGSKSLENCAVVDLNSNKESATNKQDYSVVSSNTSLKNGSIDRIELGILGDVNCCTLRRDVRKIMTSLTEVKRDVCDLREKIYETSKSCESKEEDENHKKSTINQCIITSDSAAEDKYFLMKQKSNSYKPTKCTDLIFNIEASLKHTIQSIDKRVQHFEDYVNCSLKNIDDIISRNKNEEELIRYVQDLRSELEELKTNFVQLKCIEVKQNLRFDAFTEEICLLKSIKADREAVQESLLEKADVCLLNKKVSHDEFEIVCDDLTRNFNELMLKLSQQEVMWQQLVVDMRCEIEGKLDDLQIPALRDFIDHQLQILKNQLKLLSQIKSEQEAAGAKKVLRQLHQIFSLNKQSKITKL